jgi:Icc-related predicted phosphoesterase
MEEHLLPDAILEARLDWGHSAKYLHNVGDQVVELGDGIAMASMGESTPTPWHTPRELPEDTLGEKASEVISGMPIGGVTIWNFHMPPHATGVDEAPQLDADLRVEHDHSGSPRMVPVGSTALRALIEDEQPTLGLHGHIHEGRGRYKIGRTIGFNPGSHYAEGELLGVLLQVSPRKGLRSYTFTAG